MKIFSKKKFIEVEGSESYHGGWVDECDGKEVRNRTLLWIFNE